MDADETLHKLNCDLVVEPVTVELAAGEWIETVWAPRSCDRCKPATRTGLGG